jgi:hypothetical protein
MTAAKATAAAMIPMSNPADDLLDLPVWDQLLADVLRVPRWLGRYKTASDCADSSDYVDKRGRGRGMEICTASRKESLLGAMVAGQPSMRSFRRRGSVMSTGRYGGVGW